MLQPIRLPFQGSTPGNDRERRCTLEGDCEGKDKKATYNDVKEKEGYVVLTRNREQNKQAA